MIYINMDLDKFCKKYKINVVSKKCTCGRTIITNKPFITKDYAGLTAEKCKCGNKSMVETLVTRTKEEHESWVDVLGRV